MFYEGETGSNSTLRSETADDDVHGLSRDESLAAAGKASKVEALAGLESLAFPAEVRCDATFVLSEDRGGTEDDGRNQGEARKGADHDFFPRPLAFEDFFAAGLFAAGIFALDGRADLPVSFAAAIAIPEDALGAGLEILRMRDDLEAAFAGAEPQRTFVI